jgi:hypothetical protein
MFKHSLLYPLLQSKLHKHESVTKRVLALVEPKYRGAVQEWCAKAGEPLADLLITLFTCKLGSATAGSNPPAGLAPAAVADGLAVAVVVDQGAAAASIAEAARIVSGLALMKGQGGSGGDISSSHDEAPQVAGDEKKASDLIAASEVNKDSTAILKDGYYEVNGFKISEYYYNKLWNAGRPAPTLFAKEILEVAENVVPDARPGFFRYEGLGWELIYNPATKEIWHIQPI